MLLFIRHGETDFNHKGLWMGCTDIELNERGRQQALSAAKALSEKSIDIIFTSPLKRAYITAQTIADQQLHKPPVIILNDLRERGFGILEGTPRDKPLNDDFDNIEGVEKKDTLIKRLTAVLSSIEKDAHKSILIVSHGGIFHCLTHEMGYGSNPSSEGTQIGNCQPVELFKK